jgi:thiosulfate/3-mercaptopyruvate sulfurtransferase
MDSLVTTEWLAGELGASDLKLVDATSFLPTEGRDPRAEYESEHIPGAVFMDLHEVADTDSPLPMTFPPDYRFASRMQALGLGDSDRIVVYDNSPSHSAARAWWMLRSFGARNVAMLDGGMQKWKAEGRPLESGVPSVRRGHFTASLDAAQLADKHFVSGIIHSDGHEVVDARSAERFAGESAEPRPGLASGHIPGSKNLPYGRLFRPDNSWKRGDELRAAYEEAGVDLGKPMVTTCGSGVTAAVLLFGAHLLGKEDVKLYDGSWTEWGSDPATPKAVGRA